MRLEVCRYKSTDRNAQVIRYMSYRYMSYRYMRYSTQNCKCLSSQCAGYVVQGP